MTTCSCDDNVDIASDRVRGDLRKYLSADSRWAERGFLSPDDAVWDPKRLPRTSEGTEFRWALNTSSTDLDLARKAKCSCHSLTPVEQKKSAGQHDGHHQRGDLRKHHSAETDKWSVKPDYLQTPMYDLRKHSSDDTRMAREAHWLQVPDVLPNPKPRCTCPKSKILAPSPVLDAKILEPDSEPAPPPEGRPAADERAARKKEPQPQPQPQPERKILYTASLDSRPPEVPPSPPPPLPPSPLAEPKPELKKHASEDSRLVRPRERPRDRPRANRPKLERAHAREEAQLSKKWGLKEKKQPSGGSPTDEGSKKPRSRWPMRAQFSLPVEKKESKWRSQDSTAGIKSKSLRDRPKYSIRRSMSPEPDPRQMSKLENRIVRRLISPEITITDAKWAPYEDCSPLPTIGVKAKRGPKHLSDIKWTPDSPADGSSYPPPMEPEDDKPWSDFQNVTPTHNPPPEATPCKSEVDDDEFRWRILNQVTAFPIYQGGWKDESPETTPPRRIPSPEDLSPPVWSPPVWSAQVPATPPVRRQRPSQQYSPPPAAAAAAAAAAQQQRKSIVKSRGLSKKKALRARSESQQQYSEGRLAPPGATFVRAASEEPRTRQRPQLLRSKALLEVPVAMGLTKRSLSEDVPRVRARERARGPHRARSEEVPKYEDPWFANDDLESPEKVEMRQYVTTV